MLGVNKLALLLIVPLVLAACGPQTTPPETTTPPPTTTPLPTTPPAPTTPVNVAGDWELIRGNDPTDGTRLWLWLKQNDTAISGYAYTGYRNADGSQWVEPYSNPVSGKVEGNTFTFTVDLGSEDYTFTGTKTSTGLEGTYKTSFSRTGTFSAIPWK